MQRDSFLPAVCVCTQYYTRKTEKKISFRQNTRIAIVHALSWCALCRVIRTGTEFNIHRYDFISPLTVYFAHIVPIDKSTFFLITMSRSDNYQVFLSDILSCVQQTNYVPNKYTYIIHTRGHFYVYTNDAICIHIRRFTYKQLVPVGRPQRRLFYYIIYYRVTVFEIKKKLHVFIVHLSFKLHIKRFLCFRNPE